MEHLAFSLLWLLGAMRAMRFAPGATASRPTWCLARLFSHAKPLCLRIAYIGMGVALPSKQVGPGRGVPIIGAHSIGAVATGEASVTMLDTLDAAVAAVCANPANVMAYGVALSVLAALPPRGVFTEPCGLERW